MSEDLVALPGFGGDDREYVDHGVPLVAFAAE
jgi:hypothetical protein